MHRCGGIPVCQPVPPVCAAQSSSMDSEVLASLLGFNVVIFSKMLFNCCLITI